MKSYRLSELASLLEAQLVGKPDYMITGVENLEAASSCEAAFLENPRYEKQLEKTQAGVVLVQPSAALIPGKNYLICKNPSLAFQTLIELFITPSHSGFEGIHPTAVIHPEALLAPDVTLGPYVVIDRGVKIGSQTVIEAHSYIGADSVIGRGCRFYPHVTVRENCQIGDRVILQPGAVIGSCGFGYFTDSRGRHNPLRQLGKVVLEDDVEIGANTTVDRARFKATLIKRGTKVDNLVQIAHQVELGEDNLIVSQVGIAGSTKTGRHVVMGGQVGVAGHLTIGDGVMLAARAGVSKSLLEPGPYSGAPAAPLKEFHAQFVQLRSFGRFVKRLKELETKVAELEKETPAERL